MFCWAKPQHRSETFYCLVSLVLLCPQLAFFRLRAEKKNVWWLKTDMAWFHDTPHILRQTGKADWGKQDPHVQLSSPNLFFWTEIPAHLSFVNLCGCHGQGRSRKTDSIASEPEAIVDLEVVKQASSRVADAKLLGRRWRCVWLRCGKFCGGFENHVSQKSFQQQKELASTVSLTWASACSGFRGRLLCHGSNVQGSLPTWKCWCQTFLEAFLFLRVQQGQAEMDPSSCWVWPFEIIARQTPCSDDSEDSQVDGSDSCLFQDIPRLGWLWGSMCHPRQKLPSSKLRHLCFGHFLQRLK